MFSKNNNIYYNNIARIINLTDLLENIRIRINFIHLIFVKQ